MLIISIYKQSRVVLSMVIGILLKPTAWYNGVKQHRPRFGMDGMEAFLYTEGIQLTAAHSGGRYSDLTQEEVQHLWRYNLYSQG